MTPPAEAEAVIRTRALARAFGSQPAVRSLDLDVFKGELFGLVGPDGGGKSTAIRLLAGLLRPTGGEGRVLGHDLSRPSAALKARLGYLAQQFTLYGDLTVDENIEFFAALHGVTAFQARRDALLERTQLTPFRRRLAQALSGGMKKKLALACTLIHTPELLLLDEPSTGVDPVSRGEFWNLLSDELERGLTVVMTTPYLDEAERCHRIALMHRGTVWRTGAPETVRAAMRGRMYSVEGAEAGALYRALRRRWSAERVVRVGGGVRFWAEQEAADADAARTWLTQQGFPAATLRAQAPSLEDAFVALLGGAGAEAERA